MTLRGIVHLEQAFHGPVENNSVAFITCTVHTRLVCDMNSTAYCRPLKIEFAEHNCYNIRLLTKLATSGMIRRF